MLLLMVVFSQSLCQILKVLCVPTELCVLAMLPLTAGCCRRVWGLQKLYGRERSALGIRQCNHRNPHFIPTLSLFYSKPRLDSPECLSIRRSPLVQLLLQMEYAIVLNQQAKCFTSYFIDSNESNIDELKE
jgi:hypothetical protein